MVEPAFVAFIPGPVRYDKDLCASAKLLYAEITARADASGVCETGNKQFADVLGVHPDTVTGWVRQLKDKSYVAVSYWTDPATGNKRRKMWIDRVAATDPQQVKTPVGPPQQAKTPGGQQVKTPVGGGANRQKRLILSNNDKGNETISLPLKGANAPGGLEKVGTIPEEPESYSTADINASEFVRSGVFQEGYGPVFRKMNNWDKLEDKLKKHEELNAPDLLLVFRKMYREKGLGEYPHSQDDTNKLKGFITATGDLGTAGRLRIMEFYLSRWEYRHKEWDVESQPTVGIMIGFLRQYVGLALEGVA